MAEEEQEEDENKRIRPRERALGQKFTNPEKCSHLQKCCHFRLLCFDFSKNNNIFERNEDCVLTVFLK